VGMADKYACPTTIPYEFGMLCVRGRPERNTEASIDSRPTQHEQASFIVPVDHP
jgi:hypothetical protein